MSNGVFYQRSPSSRMYGYALGAIWNSGFWLPDPDWALEQDPNVWEVVLRDPIVAHAINQRLSATASIEPGVHPGGQRPEDKHAAEIGEAAIAEIDGWGESRYQLAKVILMGRTYGFVGWERRRLVLAGHLDNWCVPVAITPVDKRRIQYVPTPTRGEDGREKYPIRVQMQRKADAQWIDLSDDALRQFIAPRYDDEESRLGYGRGILGAVYFYNYAKGQLMKDGLRGIARLASGMPVVTLGPDRMASAGKDNDARRTAWLQTIAKMDAQGGLVFENGDTIELKYPSGEGARATTDFIRYLDEGVTQLILGSVLPTGGGADVGSNARAEVESESSQILVQHDRRILDDAYSKTIFDGFWRHNVPQLCRAGVYTARKPKIRSIQESREDPKTIAETAKVILDSGVPLKRSEYYERVGWEQPADGEDVIEGTAAPADPFGFGAPGGGFGGGGKPPFGGQGEKPEAAERPEPVSSAA